MLETAISAARSAAKILMDNFGKISPDDIRRKSANDFLTFVDEEAEKKIIETIHNKFPSHSILAEESGLSEEAGDFEWIIDPLDGTTNYISGVPIFAVSIGVRHNKELQLGVVLDPVRNELFFAEKSKGAFLNGKPIHVSTNQNLKDCLFATGFPFKYKEYLSTYLNCFHDIFIQCSGARRMGSAALDLSYVACGRFDFFWEIGLNPWDIAAGSLIITEAGGQVSDFWGKNSFLSNGFYTATNGMIHHQILEIIQRHFKSEYKR